MTDQKHRPNKLNSQHIKEINKRIKARRETKETFTQIGADYGVTCQTIGYHARKLPPAIHRRPEPARVDDAEVLRLYGLHMNQSIVAKELGVPFKTISRALARMEWKAAA